MNLFLNLSHKLNLLINSLYFFKKHFLVILALGLVSAFGRVIQLGGFGPVSSFINLVLEVVVEFSRILLFLYVLGWAHLKKGVLRIRHLFIKDRSRKAVVFALQKLRNEWLAVLLNIIFFGIIAWSINYLIDLLAYQTCLYLTLKNDGILSNGSSEWTILLFFKNLTVIPLTLIFDTVLLLWLSDKLTNNRSIALPANS